jgi:hypothetical protein
VLLLKLRQQLDVFFRLFVKLGDTAFAAEIDLLAFVYHDRFLKQWPADHDGQVVCSPAGHGRFDLSLASPSRFGGFAI